MKPLLSLIFLLATFHSSLSQATPEQLTATFFKTFEKEGSSVALDQLYATNPWMSRSTDGITKLKSQVEDLNEDFVGKYHGYEKITKKALGSSYMLLSYMVKYDRQPIRFIFHYYKPKDHWVLYSFKFDASIDDELEEAAKIYFQEW